MSRKKAVWFEVAEDETVADCLQRMAADGYSVTGRKEEPLFADVDGEVIAVRQLIKFSGVLTES